MKKNSFLWAALSMTAALVMTACSSDDNDMTEAPVAPSTSKTIPYTVTVGGDEATTRATVDADNKTLRFATGDKLYITGTNIQGVLDLQAGDEGKASGATFSGDLTYSGEGSPADNLQLTATLVSTQQTVDNQISVDAAGAVTVNYPTTAYCTSVNDAVQKYSNLTGTSTYGAKSFTLTQQTAFLNFVITFEDATTTGTELTAVVNNNSSDICSASVTTETVSEKVVAKFVLPVAAGTTLSSANVKMGDKEAISFGASQELTGKVYNVKKTIAASSSLTGQFSVSTTKKVCFSKGNLRYASGTWSFFDNQYDYYTSYSADAWDKFGWSTSATTYGMNTSTDNATYSGDFVDWGSNSDLQTALGTGWFTLSSDEWTYVFNTRTTGGTVFGTSSGRYAHATINTDGTSVNGMILFPDGVDIASTEVTTAGSVNATSAYATKCTTAQWSALAAKGCVFLPAAGFRWQNTRISDAGSIGDYWSSSPNGASNAYAMQFYSGNLYLYPVANFGRYYGFSVRLVRQVE